MPSLVYITRIHPPSVEAARVVESSGFHVKSFDPGEITADECVLVMTSEAVPAGLQLAAITRAEARLGKQSLGAPSLQDIQKHLGALRRQELLNPRQGPRRRLLINRPRLYRQWRILVSSPARPGCESWPPRSRRRPLGPHNLHTQRKSRRRGLMTLRAYPKLLRAPWPKRSGKRGESRHSHLTKPVRSCISSDSSKPTAVLAASRAGGRVINLRRSFAGRSRFHASPRGGGRRSR